MINILKSEGVEQIKALGEKFDPALHEAMMQRSEPEREDNIVLEEFQKGYKLNGRVIRPSKVIVNRIASKKNSNQERQTEQEAMEKLDMQKQNEQKKETTEVEE